MRIVFNLCWFIMAVLRTQLSSIEESFWWKSSGAANYFLVVNSRRRRRRRCTTSVKHSCVQERMRANTMRQTPNTSPCFARPHHAANTKHKSFSRAQKSLNLGRYLKVHSHLVLGTLVIEFPNTIMLVI